MTSDDALMHVISYLDSVLELTRTVTWELEGVAPELDLTRMRGRLVTAATEALTVAHDLRRICGAR